MLQYLIFFSVIKLTVCKSASQQITDVKFYSEMRNVTYLILNNWLCSWQIGKSINFMLK